GQQDRGQVAGAQAGVAQVALDRTLREAAIHQQRGGRPCVRRRIGLDEQRVAAAARGEGGHAEGHEVGSKIFSRNQVLINTSAGTCFALAISVSLLERSTSRANRWVMCLRSTSKAASGI